MPKLDPFSAQIVQLVRQMPDDAILELVRKQLGGVKAVTASAMTGRSSASTTKSASSTTTTATKPRRARKRRARQSQADKKAVLSLVERAVKGARGLSASQVAKKTKIAQTRVSAALRELKQSKRIYQGGERRFARYASDAKTANRASNDARKNMGKRK